MLEMIKKLLKKLLDPRGPAADILTTESYWKETAGLPYSAGIRQRVEPAPIPASEVQKACLPDRYFAKGEIDVPWSRERQASPYVTERYIAVQAGMETIGWTVRQEPRSPFCDCQKARFGMEGGQFVHQACGRRRAPLSDQELVEKIASIQFQPGDTHYQRYAETIPGKDRAIIDGIAVKGGTWVKSRKHYNELTKGWVHWDTGTPKAVDHALAEQKQKQENHLKVAVADKARLISDRPGDR
jgi:hypothetical protein